MARTKGSVTHCSHCHQPGHTKRTCPSLGKMSKAEKAFRSRGRCKHCGSMDHKPNDCPYKPDRRPRSKCRCSHCKEVGHTRRTCDVLKADLKAANAANALYRKDFLETLRSQGIGVGTLVTKVKHVYDEEQKNASSSDDDLWLRKERTYMITGINWERVNICNVSSSYRNDSVNKYLVEEDRNTINTYGYYRINAQWVNNGHRWGRLHSEKNYVFDCVLLGKPLRTSAYSGRSREQQEVTLGVGVEDLEAIAPEERLSLDPDKCMLSVVELLASKKPRTVPAPPDGWLENADNPMERLFSNKDI